LMYEGTERYGNHEHKTCQGLSLDKSGEMGKEMK
jgi:hypothetical protein